MRKPLALAALMATTLLAGQAHAASHWLWFTVNGGAVAFDELSQYFDIRTGIVSANTVTFYQQPHAGAGGAYAFLAERLDFECRGNRYRFSNSAAFDRAGLKLSEREDGEWSEMGATLGSTALFKRMLCTNEKPPVLYQAADVEALFKAMTSPTLPTPMVQTPPATTTAVAPAPARPAPAPTPPPEARPSAAAQTAAKPPEPPKIQPKPLDLDALAASLASPSSPAPAPAPAAPKPALQP